jgi:hypothetical protein
MTNADHPVTFQRNVSRCVDLHRHIKEETDRNVKCRVQIRIGTTAPRRHRHYHHRRHVLETCNSIRHPLHLLNHNPNLNPSIRTNINTNPNLLLLMRK